MKLEILFLKISVILIGIPFLALAIYGLPWVVNDAAGYFPAYLVYPVLICVYISLIPFFASIYQAVKILSYIDKSEFFSVLSIRSFKNIKYCTRIMSGLYLVAVPFLYIIADKDDAPGLLLIGLVLIFISILVAVFSSVIQKLLKNAVL